MDIAISKYCGKCKTPKPTSYFWKGGGPDGLQAYCRDCMREYRKKSENVDENCLYVLSYEYSLDGPFKTRRTACVEARVAQLEASQCFRIVVHACFPQRGDLEKKVHEQLAAFQVTGVRGKRMVQLPARDNHHRDCQSLLNAEGVRRDKGN